MTASARREPGAGRTSAWDLVLVVLLAVLLPLAVHLPLRAARAAAAEDGDGWTGLFPSRDHAQYASLADQARDEPSLLLRNPYDADEERPTILALGLTAAGVLSAASGRSVAAALTGLGLFAAALLALAAWRLVVRLHESDARRRTAFLCLLLSGGLAFFVARAVRIWPAAIDWTSDLDFSVGWSVFGALHNPLWALGLLLSIALMSSALAADRDPSWRRLVPVAILGILVEPTHPYLGAGCLATLVLFALSGPARWRLLAALVPGLVVAGLHVALVLTGGDDAPGRIAVHRYTPAAIKLVGGYGLLLPLAVLGLVAQRGRPGPARRLRVAWLIAGIALLYNPIVVGVKFILFLHPALALLTADGLAWIAAARRARPRLVTGVLVTLGLALATSAPQVLRVQEDAARKDPESRVAPGESEALAALASAPPGPVLCAPDLGTRLPWLTGRRPHLGHWFLTPSYRKRLLAVRAAFDPDAPADMRLRLLDDAGIAAVLVRERDRKKLFGADPPAPFLRAFEAGECVLFVRPTGP